MTSQEIVDKLSEVRYEANCTSVPPTRLITDLIGIVLAQQEQIAALMEAETERTTKAKREASARRMASSSPYDASKGGFHGRR